MAYAIFKSIISSEMTIYSWFFIGYKGGGWKLLSYLRMGIFYLLILFVANYLFILLVAMVTYIRAEKPKVFKIYWEYNKYITIFEMTNLTHSDIGV